MPEHLVNIGEVIVNGIVFDPKNGERLRAMDLDTLLKSVPRLFDLLEERNVEYALVGGIAMLTYLEGRNTQDIDLIAPREALDRLPEIIVEYDNPEFARAKLGELSVDFLFTKNKLFERVQSEHVVLRDFAERKIPCATVEGIVMLKLFALPSLYRQMTFEKVDIYQNDVMRLIREYDPDMKPILAEVAKHVLPGDNVEIRKIVDEIHDHIAKSRKRFTNGDEE